MSAARAAKRGFRWPLVAMLLLVAAPAEAHKQHRSAAAAESPTTAAATARESVAADSASPAAGSRPPAYPMPPMREALLEHPHNKLVHFPLALALVAALLLVLGRRRPELDVSGRWLAWLAALGGIAAYFTGRIQHEAFEGEPKEWLVGLHGRWGTVTTIVLVVWALLTLWKPARKRAWLWGLLAAALVLITGFYGGIVAHGE